jgi:thymidylate synthase
MAQNYAFTVNTIRRVFKDMLAREDFVTDKTGVKMLEMVGAQFNANEPAIFGEPNQDYIERELQWYRSMSLNVNSIPGGPPAIWKQVATPDGMINSNYGYLIWSYENEMQYESVLTELMKNPNSRRAVMIYTRPTMHRDYNTDGMSDFICTNAVQYMIRDDKLQVVVQMRSNDVVYGYRNDWAWQRYVQNMLATDLDVGLGDIFWQVGSLHVYERHFDLVK